MTTLIDFLVSVEGSVKKNGLHQPYKDEAGLWTVGYGHLLPPITEDLARDMLQDDVRGAVRAVDRLVTLPLTPNQKNAVVSLVFNVGQGALKYSKALQHLNDGDLAGFESEAFGSNGFNKITKGGKKVFSKGLHKRRQKELALFRGKYNE